MQWGENLSHIMRHENLMRQKLDLSCSNVSARIRVRAMYRRKRDVFASRTIKDINKRRDTRPNFLCRPR